MAEAELPARVAPGRSCIACRRRKIRCDRSQPCSYCAKLHVQCIYPGPSQKSRSPPERDMLSRLQTIETSLLRLESRIGTRGYSFGFQEPSSTIQERLPAPDSLQMPAAANTSSPLESAPAAAEPETTAELENGKLFFKNGGTRYVTDSFWADLEEGDKDEMPVPDQLTEAESSIPSSMMTEPIRYFGGSIFGLGFAPGDLQHLHPPDNRIFVLWQIFLESVDPLLKILHIPVTQRQMLQVSHKLDDVPPVFEALMFSIYYAAVTSLQCSVSCQNLLKEERQTLLDRYRFGVEQALHRANFLSAPDITSLQALTLYLICARRNADKTFTWSMTALAVRLAVKLGLHRDPVFLQLSPFMTELRRRLWWQICILDVRTAEENDMDPMICEHSFDTKFPSNVNDSDLDVNMDQPLRESSNRTEMLFTLTRLKISYEARKIVFSSRFTADNGYPRLSAPEKSRMVDMVQTEIEEKWLKNCDTSVPICFLAVTSTRMVLSKMKLTIHHPARSGSAGLSHDLLVDLIGTALGIIEYAHTLRTSDKYSKWIWLFQEYIEWDAVAFLLHSLIAAPVDTLSEKIWAAIDVFFEDWQGHAVDGDRRWRRLESLKTKAKAKSSGQNDTGQNHQDAEPSLATCASKTFQESGARPIQSMSYQDLAGPVQHPNDADTLDVIGQNANLSANVDGNIDWNFGCVQYTQGAPTWEMDYEDDAFNSWL